MAEVYREFSGQRSGILRFLGRRGVDRVLLLATKADTVPPDQRAALQDLLTDMCRGAIRSAAGVDPRDVHYVAAIRATSDVEHATEDGKRLLCVEGVCSERGKRQRISFLDIPDATPPPDYFLRCEGRRPPRFAPHRIAYNGSRGIPNLRLGQALDTLLGDLLK